MRIILLNLTRFGDLLQSQPIIHALHAHGHEVGLVCLQNFADAARLIDGISFVSALPGGGFLADLDAGWPRALTRLHAWRQEVFDGFAPHEVLNLTSTPAARLLAGLLARETGRKPRGFALDEHGFGVSGLAWTAFFEASTRKRGCSPFNIIDVFLRASGLEGPARYSLLHPAPDIREAARQRLRAMAAAAPPQRDITGYVALQLGASEAKRQWPVRFFAATGRKLFEEFGLMPVLLGSAQERHLAEAYLRERAPGLDLTGSTSLTELAAVLGHMRLLLTNDTGTMHLAAGLGIDCLAVFLATAQPWDTGPYREGCCSLEPALDCHPCGFGDHCPHGNRCLEQITPEAVWPLLHGYFSGRGWTCGPESALRSRVWAARRDRWGYMDLVSLSGHEEDDRTGWIRLQRHFYRQFLDMADAKAQPETPAEMLRTENLAARLSEVCRARNSAVLEQADGLLHLLQEQGRLVCMRPSERLGRQFLATCQRLSLLFDEHDAFNAMGRLWQILSQERGTNMPDLLEFIALLRASLQQWNNVLK